ncbi:MAG: ribokinase [Thermoguttaceae bacterium]|nr:ribokinase [Thermoguttaceae bacterium]
MSQPSEKPSIVVVGSSNTDMVIKADHLPVPGETILGGEFMMAAGGKGANQAVAAARLGGQVTFVSRVGNDSLGEQAIAGYRAEGIDTSLIQRDEKPTGVALILVDDKGQNVISVAPGANYSLSPADADRAEEAIARAKMVIVQLETPLDTIERTAKIAARHGVAVILDPAPAPSEPLSDELLANITYIKPNETEASRLTGIDVVDEASARRAAEVLLAKGPRGVIVTLGAAGALVVPAEGRAQVLPSKKVDAVDATAAGDCFSGALAVALAGGKSLLEAARFAIDAAAISVTRMGAQPSLPYARELEDR